jgi:hypothetical protein
MTLVEVQCATCRHLYSRDGSGDRHCDAFPKGRGIPDIILRNDHDHRDEYPGDNGVRWEPATHRSVHPLDEEPPDED